MYQEFEGRSRSGSMGLIGSGPPRPDTRRLGEGKRPPESDGPVASSASVESNGGILIG